MSILREDERLRSHRLGACYPYWWIEAADVHYAPFAPEALRAYPAQRRHLDPVSVLALLSFEHLALDRTMVEGLLRAPWLGEVDHDGTAWFAEAPPHGNAIAPTAMIARKFLEASLAELRAYCAEGRDIYLLLSGGMDSRVFAAMLKHLQDNGEIEAPIRTVTWGVDGCRDVLYGERLARHFGWEWIHAPLTAESYWDCFELAAEQLGAEIDPKHVHRMDWFAQIEKPSLVLAASYGDSVGRAEFGGVHVSGIDALQPLDRNRLLHDRARAYATDRLMSDVHALRHRHGPRSEIGYRELERQAHYMRRMLQHTMCVVNQYGHRLEQAFVTRPVFELMWSYDPSVRTDAIYVDVLKTLDPSLLDVAWARTGARYDTGEGADEASKQHHRYGYWLREHHADRLGELLFGTPTLAELDTFDLDQTAWMYDEWRREDSSHETLLCTQLSMMATISLFARKFAVKAPNYDGGVPVDEDHVGKLLSRLSQRARRVSRPWRLRLREAFLA